MRSNRTEGKRPPHLKIPKWLEQSWWVIASIWTLLVVGSMVGYPFLYPCACCSRFRPEWPELIILLLPLVPLLLLVFPPNKIWGDEPSGRESGDTEGALPPTDGQDGTPSITLPKDAGSPATTDDTSAKEKGGVKDQGTATFKAEIASGLFIEAQQALVSGDWLKAIQKGLEAVTQDPRDTRSAALLGFIFGEGSIHQDFYRSIFFSELALLRNAGDYSSHMNLGLALYHSTFKDDTEGRLQQARRHLEQSIRLLSVSTDPRVVLERGKSHLFSGLVLRKMGQNESAKREFQQAISELSTIAPLSDHVGVAAKRWMENANEQLKSLNES